MSARVALIDSGVNAAHPHVQGVGVCIRGPTIDATGQVHDDAVQDDRLGHGTAAAAAILHLAPRTILYSIRIFHEAPSCPFENVLAALRVALDWKPDLINLSLGTPDPRWCSELELVLERATISGTRLVAPASFQGLPCYPGALLAACGVLADPNLPRELPEIRESGERSYWYASPFPRDLPGLPREANLRGISFAAANLSGYLASQLAEGRDRQLSL